MSRIGYKIIEIPEGVEIKQRKGNVSVKGPLGDMEFQLPEGISMKVKDQVVSLDRISENKKILALHGLSRSLLANMVHGVTTGFEKILEIHGIGYRAAIQGNTLSLHLGFSHPIKYSVPKGLDVKVENQNVIIVRGSDKQQVGHVAAVIRSFRKVEPYKGKGIRYRGEAVRRKVGKAAASGG